MEPKKTAKKTNARMKISDDIRSWPSLHRPVTFLWATTPALRSGEAPAGAVNVSAERPRSSPIVLAFYLNFS